MTDEPLTNHEITICLQGGATLGPFKSTWSHESKSDVRELSKDFDAYLKGEPQTRYKYHLHDIHKHLSHSVLLRFEHVTAIYDRVQLTEHDDN